MATTPKNKTAARAAVIPPAPQPPSASLAEDAGGLPLPAGEPAATPASSVAVAGATLSAAEEPDLSTIPPGVSEEVIAAVGDADDAPVVADDALVNESHAAREARANEPVWIRATQELATPPTIGKFAMTECIGVEARNRQRVRGKYLPNYLYRVPRYVAGVLIGRGQAVGA